MNINRVKRFLRLSGHKEAVAGLAIASSLPSLKKKEPLSTRSAAPASDITISDSALTERIFSVGFDRRLICWDAFDMSELSSVPLRDPDEVRNLVLVTSPAFLPPPPPSVAPYDLSYSTDSLHLQLPSSLCYSFITLVF